MDVFFKDNQHLELFNKLKQMYNQLKYKDVENTPCCIFVEFYTRLQTGSLVDEPTFLTSSLERLSNLEYLKQGNDYAYIIHGICLLPKIGEFPEFTKLQDFKNHSFANGLYLAANDYLGRQIKNKFDHYSPSWFDDYDSN